MADEHGPGIDTNPGQRIADKRQRGIRELFQLAVYSLSPLVVKVFFGFGVPQRPFVFQALQKAEGVCRIPHLS